MWGCPVEDDGEEPDRGQRNRVSDSRPTNQDGHGARRAPDHNVLCRGALEPHSVDEDIEEDGGTCQRRAEEIDEGHEDNKRAEAQYNAEDQGLGWLHPPGGQRTALCTSHDLIDVAVDIAVNTVRA